MDKSLTSGSMGMMLLKLLSEKDMYGYEMIETGKTRVYYSISKNGNMFLKEKKEEWAVYVKAVSDVLAMGV